MRHHVAPARGHRNRSCGGPDRRGKLRVLDLHRELGERPELPRLRGEEHQRAVDPEAALRAHGHALEGEEHLEPFGRPRPFLRPVDVGERLQCRGAGRSTAQRRADRVARADLVVLATDRLREQPVRVADVEHERLATGRSWNVREVASPDVPPTHGPRCLVFESAEAVRRVWSYPDVWWELFHAELEAISWEK